MNNIQNSSVDITSLHVLTVYFHPKSVTIHGASFITSVSISRPPATVYSRGGQTAGVNHRTHGHACIHTNNATVCTLYIIP